MNYLSLLELNALVKETLSTRMEPSYWVVAEIGEMRLTQKGHCYLELIEKENNFTLAKIRATLWSYNYRRLSGWFEAITGQDLRAGMKILSQVEVNFHEVYGLSLNIKDIDANFTLGERARKKQEVLARLAEEGVLEMNKSLALPLVPQRIAVISSPTAAGLGDFMDQLSANRFGYHFGLQLFKALMQGDQAAESIVEAMLRVFDLQESGKRSFDLVVIIRGGGAQVDLDCFDSYELAAHIAQFPLPVVTGIGHERDETVADMVAHTRMKTPTAVAEFLISGMADFEDKLEQSWYKISNVARHIIRSSHHELDSLLQQLRFGVYKSLQSEKEKIQQWSHQIRTASHHHSRKEHEKILFFQKKLQAETRKLILRRKDQLNQMEKYMKASDPERILKKGFSYTLVNGKPLRLNSPLQEGDEVETRAFQQTLVSRLEKIVKLSTSNGPTKKD